MNSTVKGPSPWLFPATYAIHLAEEACCGETFPGWISRVGSLRFTAHGFVVVNSVAMVAMTLAVLAIERFPRARLLRATLATIVLVNGLLHTVGTVVTWSYSPGLWSGALLWVPLGLSVLWGEARALRRAQMLVGIALGFLAHAGASSTLLLNW